jgi:hypothetical protein
MCTVSSHCENGSSELLTTNFVTFVLSVRICAVFVVGFLLHRINGELVEHLSYDEAMGKVLRSKSPHFAEFIRYDYRFNPFTNEWRSLQELRDLGVCVEDPLFARINFVNTAAQGRLKDIHDLLLQGEDPNSSDLSGNTALVMAAANKHPEVVEMLVNAGANVNCRDKNVSAYVLLALFL